MSTIHNNSMTASRFLINSVRFMPIHGYITEGSLQIYQPTVNFSVKTISYHCMTADLDSRDITGSDHAGITVRSPKLDAVNLEVQ